jgi:methionine--tRNA ligase beta chain
MTFSPAPIKAEVSITVLEQLDIRVGTIVSVDELAASRKLVRLRVDLGDHQRTILAGLKGERSNLQALVGAQALFMVNLRPREMAGEISEGMLFDIGYADGIVPVLAIPEGVVPNGVRAG